METAAGFHPFRIEMAALTGPPSMWQNEVCICISSANPHILLAYDYSN